MAKGNRTRKKGRAGGRRKLLNADQQREVLAVGLVALSLLVVLALLPTSVFGARGAELFPSGNMVGSLGAVLRGGLLALMGVGSVLVPPLLLLSGAAVGGWGPRPLMVRLAVMTAGLALLLPVAAGALAVEGGGWWGRTAAAPLVGLVGWLGAIVVLGLLTVVLCVTTIRWNPLDSLATQVAGALRALRRGVAALREEVRRRREEGRRGRPEAEGRDVPGEVPTDDTAGAGEVPEAADAPDSGDEGELRWTPAEATVAPADSGSEGDRPAAYELPPIDLLDLYEPPGRRGMEKELDRLGDVLVDRLRTFNVESELAGRTTGPVVTQFEVVPAAGVKVNRIANLDADLALAMKAPSVRIVAPIPGKGAVGVEIPNPQPEIVQLREILEAPAFESAKGALPLGLGKDLTGRPYVADLAKMPHLLIAGATGSGKSVCINTIITSLVFKHTPDTLRLLMIDPKMVELSAYADLPHLRHPVVTDPEEAAGVLKWAVLEMERRYRLLSANGVRSVGEFNRRVHEGAPMRRSEARDGEASEGDEDRWIYDEGLLPYVVVVVDELADLIMQVQSEVEKPLAQLAQKARAIGIHLIVATQRPSVNVITGLIKANFPTRIGFRVASKTDSRTILDQNGAESLLGNGDMLFLPPGESEAVRIQGAYLSTEDTDRLIGWYRDRVDGGSEPVSDGSGETDILDQVRAAEQLDAAEIAEEIRGEWDELFRAAAEVCISQQQGSTSLLQRKLRIGYGRAARIVDQLHDAGVVGPPDGSKPREVLITLGELDEICGSGSG